MLSVLSTLNNASLPISMLSSVEKISSDDLFIVERANEIASDIVATVFLETKVPSVVDSLRAKMVEDVIEYIHSNGKIQYKDLSARVFEDISNAFNFNTMAFKDNWEYSKKSHSHRGLYSDVECYPRYSKHEILGISQEDAENIDPEDIPEWLGTFTTSRMQNGIMHSVEHEIYMPRLKQPVFNYPDIGEVRFAVQTTNFEKVEIETETIEVNVYCSADIVFLIDYTGSMAGTIDKLKNSIGQFFDSLNELAGDYKIKHWRGRIVAFGDQECDGVNWIKINPFRNAVSELKNDLANLGTVSGGDAYEELLRALAKICFQNGSNPSDNYSNESSFANVDESSVLNESKWRVRPNPPYQNQLLRFVFMFTDNDTKTNSVNRDFLIQALAKNNFYLALFAPSKTNFNKFFDYDYEFGTKMMLKTSMESSSKQYATLDEFNNNSVTLLDNLAKTVSELVTTETIPKEDEPKNVDMPLLYDKSLDGYWAYCNGQTITCTESEFVDACKLYGSSANSTTFTVPKFNNFIRLNPRVQTENATQFVNHHNGLVDHRHNIKSDLNESDLTMHVSSKLTIPTTTGAGKASSNTRVHSGSASSLTNTGLKIECNIKDVNLVARSGGESDEIGNDTETRPSSIEMPLIVYLGKK